MKTPLHTLDIEKYVQWYYNLSLSLFCLPLTTDRYKRYYLTSFRLHSRYIMNAANLKSRSIGEELFEKAKKLEKETNDLKHYTDERISKLFFLPTLEDWQAIRFQRNVALETDLEGFASELERSPLPEIELIKLHLERVETEFYPDWIEAAKRGQPLQASIDWFSFAIGLGHIDYVKHLQKRVAELEKGVVVALPGINPENLIWKGSDIELFTLFADLKTFGLIEGTKADIARIICKNFRGSDGQPFAFSNVQSKLQSDNRSKKRVDLSPLI